MEMGERWTAHVEILSPVHVGSGECLDAADLAVIEGQLWRFDPERLAAALARDPRILDRYLQEGAAALRAWPEADRRACARYVRPWSGPAPREMRAHIADPLGRPYLPGSSIKGAIRTALAFAALSAMPDQERRARMDEVEQWVREEERGREFADEPLMQALMGSDPHHDLLRALRISDSAPAPLEALDIACVRVAVREPDGTLAWLRRPGEHVADPQQAFEVHLEVIRPGIRPLSVEVGLDAFVLAAFPEARQGWLRAWGRHCNAFARYLAKGERAFGEQVGWAAYADFYRRLLEAMAADPTAVYLNIGWGGGWRSKTAAEAMGPEAVRRLRGLFRLGRGDPFPKTRRVGWVDGVPAVPLGWIRLRPAPGG